MRHIRAAGIADTSGCYSSRNIYNPVCTSDVDIASMDGCQITNNAYFATERDNKTPHCSTDVAPQWGDAGISDRSVVFRWGLKMNRTMMGMSKKTLGAAISVAGLIAVLIVQIPQSATAASSKVSPPMTATEATVSPCADVLFIGARGSGESYDTFDGYGHMVAKVRDGFVSTLRTDVRVRQLAVDYPAPPTEQAANDVRDGTNIYFDSMAEGRRKIEDVIADSQQRCPSEKLVLAGYSAGAGVVHSALLTFGDVEKLVGVVLIADPSRHKNHANAVTFGNPAKVGGLLYGLGVQFGSIPKATRMKTIEYCLAYDPVCDVANTSLLGPAFVPAALAQVAIGKSIHEQYGRNLDKSGAEMAKVMNSINGPRPTIGGSPFGANKLLTAKIGAWAAESIPVTYQWYRGNQPIAGATAQTYTPVWDDYLTPSPTLRVVVSGPDSGYANHTISSDPIALIPTPNYTITKPTGGVLPWNGTLNAKTGSWDASPFQIGYRWSKYDCQGEGAVNAPDGIPGAIKKSYKIDGSADYGCMMSLSFFIRDADGSVSCRWRCSSERLWRLKSERLRAV
ncbi:cutinase family protein, partial [Herbiconiux moechotypicola]|uniref:Cutinase family protein n=1 Tax=Herbiconiux moechotypicola TaxID=637393 RepID=A0ABN3E6F0_9MICO